MLPADADGFQKADPPTTKQLPVEAGIPEFLVQLECLRMPTNLIVLLVTSLL
jgi:hypothetical protein